MGWRDPSLFFAWLVQVGDVAIIISVAWLAHALLGIELSFQQEYLPVVLATGLFAYVVLPWMGIYRSWRGGGTFELLGRVTLAWLLVMLLVFSVLYFLRYDQVISRFWLIGWVVGVGVALGVSRIVLYALLRFMRRRGWNHRRVLLVGIGQGIDYVLGQVRDAAWSGYDVLDTLVVEDATRIVDEQDPLLQRLVVAVRQRDVEEVWISAPLRDEQFVRLVMDVLRDLSVNVRYAPDLFSLRLLNHSVSEVLGVAMLDLSSTPMVGINRVIKAMEDRLLALVIMVMISPLLVVIAVAVKLSSPGPILFKQVRHGWDGREIKIYKFRSMIVHEEPNGEVTQASRGDKRVTRVGAFLRRTSLDELPQFFNVLQGRMSIVGPRPHALLHNEEYKGQIDRYMLRHRVKPGITGWAQVNGFRGETDLEKMRRRVEYDLYYIEHWSLWFDLRIIFLTIKSGFCAKEAY